MAALPVGSSWAKGDEEDVTVIENCYCPCCKGGKAVATMLPTKVPLFREIILMNLVCDECAFRNSEVNFGGEIQEKGERLTLTVNQSDDLNRQIIKSDSATLIVPELELEIPPQTQRGTISTLEGMLKRAAENLEMQQPERLRLGDVDNFHRCRTVIEKLRRFAGEKGEDSDHEGPAENVFPYHIILDDPAGNSYIENPFAPKLDPAMKSEKYWRTPTQDMSLGLQPSQTAIDEGKIDDSNPDHKNIVNAAKGSHHIEKDLTKKSEVGSGDDGTTSLGRQEVIRFDTTCPHCRKPTETDMCMTDIPHFKEVIIMSMLCENCGFRSNEVKGGGAIPKFGTKITLTVRGPDDLGREVLKSDTAGIVVPEIELELDEGGLDGVYTTVEGLLSKLHDRLKSANPFGIGDSASQQHSTNDGGEFSGPSPNHARYMAFLRKIKDMAEGLTFPFTLILSDPLSNSFVGPIPHDAVSLALQAEKEGSSKCYDEYVDPGMLIEEYERTHEQNEILGLNDMKTENYQSDNVGEVEYYGTDAMEELPDRLRRIDVRGPDHPHQVGKAPVEGDFTVMGPGSTNFAVPSMAQRGKRMAPAVADTNADKAIARKNLQKLIHDSEYKDSTFIMSEGYDGPRDGMVFKDGAQGVGYYKDVSLIELWSQQQDCDESR